MTTKHMHCVLKHGDGSTQVSWIPAEFATEGRFLKLKENGVWRDGWQVMTAYPGLMDSDVVQARERDFKNHRKATDV